MEKMVKIRLPLSRAEKDGMYVCVNGSNMLIQRGKEVEIPESFAKVIARREKMLEYAMAFEEEAARKSEEMDNRK